MFDGKSVKIRSLNLKYLLFIEELPSCHRYRPVRRVHQMIDALTVLRGQDLICTAAGRKIKSFILVFKILRKKCNEHKICFNDLKKCKK